MSLLADNVSAGLEPPYAFRFRRRVRQRDGHCTAYEVEDFAHARWRRQHGDWAGRPPAAATATELSPEAHLAMQAALQPVVDGAIAKTINIPADFPFPDFQGIYRRAFDLGLKGCTTFRPTPERGAVLTDGRHEAPHCCSPEKEGE